MALTSVLAGPLAALTWSPAAVAQAGSSTATTNPLVPLPTTTTPTTAPPATAPPATAPPTTRANSPTTTRASSPTTTKPGAQSPAPAQGTVPGGKVPGVPTGGPPTTAPAPGTPPVPPPDPNPILEQVDTDLAQLNAIDDYKPAQALVAAAQAQVTAAGAALQSARQNLDAARAHATTAVSAKADADAKLRSMALAAYIGVGYSTPGFGAPANGNGDAGPGTVSTPGGLTGVQALDAKEMLILVGERARREDDTAKQSLAGAKKNVATATAAVGKAQADVGAAEGSLLTAQQTLKQVATAATTPGAAAATRLPNLASLAAGSPAKGAAQPIEQAAASSPAAGGPTSPDIIGPAALTGSDLAAWYASTGRQADATVPIPQLAQAYQDWGQKLGVRYDVAFAQSVVETGFFSFPAGGQLTAKDNNFAGIGACDTCAHGWSFPDAATGVGAQEELLYEYASTSGLPKGVPNVIGASGPGGCCRTWTQLAGVWASSTVYGISIMTIYHQMLSWLIPQRQIAAGLVAASSSPAAQGPELAPLPGGAAPAANASPPAPAGGVGASTTTTPASRSAKH